MSLKMWLKKPIILSDFTKLDEIRRAQITSTLQMHKHKLRVYVVSWYQDRSQDIESSVLSPALLKSYHIF